MPRNQRAKFIVAQSMGGDFLVYPGHSSSQPRIFMGDLEILAHEGLVDITYPSTSANVNVTPRGFAYYEYLKKQAGQPAADVQEAVRQYLATELFREKYPVAYQKWAAAEDLLWGSDSKAQLTTIGHSCREAFQEFATSLVEMYKPAEVDPDKKHDVARVREILDLRASQLFKTEKPFLDALLVYWGTVSDLVQRQEHGGQHEGELLVWEDARRVVFQTAIVMFEVDKALSA